MVLDFNINISEKSNVAIVRVDGEVDAHTSPQLNEKLSEAIEQGKKQIILNLDNVGFIDSAGLGTIARSAQSFYNAYQGSFKVVCSKSQLRRIFDVSGLSDEILSFYDGESEAIDSLSEGD